MSCMLNTLHFLGIHSGALQAPPKLTIAAHRSGFCLGFRSPTLATKLRRHPAARTKESFKQRFTPQH